MAGPKTIGLRILRDKNKRDKTRAREAEYAKNEANRLVVNGDGPWFVRACEGLLNSSHRSPKIESDHRLTLCFRPERLNGTRRKFVMNGYRVSRISRNKVWVSSSSVSMILVKRGGSWFFEQSQARGGGDKPHARSPLRAGPTGRRPMHGH